MGNTPLRRLIVSLGEKNPHLQAKRKNVNEVNMSQIRERTRPFRHTRESGYREGSLYGSLRSQGQVWIPAGVYPVLDTGQE